MSGAHKRLRSPVDVTDPQAIKDWAQDLRPIIADIRSLADEATTPPLLRTYGRPYLRRRILKALRDLDARVDAVAVSGNPTPGPSPQAGRGGDLGLSA